MTPALLMRMFNLLLLLKKLSAPASTDARESSSIWMISMALKPSGSVLAGAYRSMGIASMRAGNVEQGAKYYRLYLPLCTNPTEKAQLQKTLAEYDAARQK